MSNVEIADEPDQDAPLGDEAITQWGYKQWTRDGANMFPAGGTAANLKPGLYDIAFSQHRGVFFTPVPVKTEGILTFPDTPFEEILKEVVNFWSKEDRYRAYGISYKRGTLLWGPPGAGKSSLVQLVMRDVIHRGGIGINFGDPQLFTRGFRALRAIQPKTPVVVLMEDLDTILENNPKSTVLDILDGAERMENVFFMATTNYPEKLEARISNRPSRFDRRWEIKYPSNEARKFYLEHLYSSAKLPLQGETTASIVKDTEGLSFAHVKELFVATCILEDSYENSLKELKKMGQKISSRKYETGSIVGMMGGKE